MGPASKMTCLKKYETAFLEIGREGDRGDTNKVWVLTTNDGVHSKYKLRAHTGHERALLQVPCELSQRENTKAARNRSICTLHLGDEMRKIEHHQIITNRSHSLRQSLKLTNPLSCGQGDQKQKAYFGETLLKVAKNFLPFEMPLSVFWRETQRKQRKCFAGERLLFCADAPFSTAAPQRFRSKL